MSRPQARRHLALLTSLLLSLGLAACTAPSGGNGTGTTAVDAGQQDGTPTGTHDAAADGTKQSRPRVRIATSLGAIVVELNPEKAPISVASFLGYVDKQFYDGLLFHRVIAGFMIQGGGILPSGAQKQPGAPIKNEATNGLKNLRGTVAMARTSVIDSATSQFFINHKDNGFLDHKDSSAKGYGYAVFGEVVSGMAVVDKIAAVATGAADRPVTDVVITSVRREP